MVNLTALKKMDVETRYKYMLTLIEGQLSSEKDIYANISNTTAIIYAIIEKLNWCGFYFLRGEELVLGPFQGLPACNRIVIGKGVCGSSVSERKIYRVGNVHEFPGHIACDSASNSEIVLPLIKDGKIYGVLDIDSYEFDNFTELEERYLIKAVEKLNQYIQWEQL